MSKTLDNSVGPVYAKAAMESVLGAVRNVADSCIELMNHIEGRIIDSMTTGSDEEICYAELWLRQIRDRFKELDKKVGHVRQVNWKRALHLWYTNPEVKKMFGHKFRLDFHMIPSLPKEGTKERGELIEWLKAGNRMDCLVMDEYSGNWVFDFDKMESLVNQMLSEGNRPPECIKLHPQPKIVVQVEK